MCCCFLTWSWMKLNEFKWIVQFTDPTTKLHHDSPTFTALKFDLLSSTKEHLLLAKQKRCRDWINWDVWFSPPLDSSGGTNFCLLTKKTSFIYEEQILLPPPPPCQPRWSIICPRKYDSVLSFWLLTANQYIMLPTRDENGLSPDWIFVPGDMGSASPPPFLKIYRAAPSLYSIKWFIGNFQTG